jgi:prolyl oligopeptidase
MTMPGRQLLPLFALVAVAASAVAKEIELHYPPPPLSGQVDEYHGTKISDPYRVLEEPDAPATLAWIEAENRLTTEYLAAVPEREPLRKRLQALWNYERFGVPFVRGGRYFYSRNSGLQNQSVLYVADALEAEPRVLLDPNTLAADGTVALTNYDVSHDGKLLAYGLAAAGSDWKEFKVRNVATGEDTIDHLRWVKFSDISWSADDAGFYYSRYDEPAAGAELTAANYFQKLYYHKLGTPQSDDRLIYERRDEKEWGFHGHATDDGRYLIVSVGRGTEHKNLIFYRDLQQADAPVVELIAKFEAEYAFIDHDGPVFYFRTDLDAPRNRVIAIDVRKPGEVREIVPEQPGVLEQVSLFGDRLICVYLNDVKNEVRTFGLDGREGRPIVLPGIGSVGGFGGTRTDRETFYSFTGFTTPATIYRYDLTTDATTVFRAPRVDFEPNNFETKQVFYTSRDGTRVPMFIVHKKGLALDGTNPTLLYGYGGFNISLTPNFAPSRIAWLEQGGVYAVPNLRGGGEYGRAWHEAGMVFQKQNVFDDFIAAAERLIADGYTRRDRLAIHGGSNGGLLVGACLTQRPELYGAAIPEVGVLDMLRYQKFTIGWAWVNEFGSSDDAEQLRYLLKYSPLHNLKPGTHYPATLVTTADHDDRVVPAHSFKFAAALQAAQGGPAPILIRIETSAGHGAGTPTTKMIDKVADQYAFLIRALKMVTGTRP